jgi:hypothetical protein
MDSKMMEMAEMCTKHEFSEGVQREQRDIERDQAMKEIEGIRSVLIAKDKEIVELKEQCADLQSLTR